MFVTMMIYGVIVQIAQTAGGQSINWELKETLETVKSEMNMNVLPDISKLRLDDGDQKDMNYNDDKLELDVNEFLEDDDEEDEDEDDVDLIQDKIALKMMNQNVMEDDEDVDLNNDDNMIDIDQSFNCNLCFLFTFFLCDQMKN